MIRFNYGSAMKATAFRGIPKADEMIFCRQHSGSKEQRLRTGDCALTTEVNPKYGHWHSNNYKICATMNNRSISGILNNY